MDEQPIDDLFRRKLYDAEIAPDHATWAALQGRQSDKRILSLWPYVAVAAVLILIASFSWWTLAPQDKVGNQVIVTEKVHPTVIFSTPWRQQGLAEVDSVQKPQQSQSIEELSFHRGKTEMIGHKANSVRATAYKDHMELTRQPNPTPDKAERIESGTEQELGKKLSAVAVIKEVNTKMTPPATERTLIVSIDQPLPIVSTPIKSEGEAIADSGNHKSGFAMLLRKAKKLKDGEVFALGTARTGKTNRRGIGKVFEDVKESIKNNSAD